MLGCTARLPTAAARQGSRRGCCGSPNSNRLPPATAATRRIAARASSSRLPSDQQQTLGQVPEQQGSQQAASQLDRRAGERGSSSNGGSMAGVAGVAAGITAVPLVLPTAASASSVLATLVPYSLQQQQSWQTVCWGCTAVGAASLLVTLVCTSRFLVSYYPSLERQAEQQRWRLPWVAVTLFDPLLQPLRRRFFGQTEEGDLDYAAVALLAVVCSLLECLVGKDGVMLPFIPDFALRDALQYLVIFQHGFLLPLWVIVVLRWGRIL